MNNRRRGSVLSSVCRTGMRAVPGLGCLLLASLLSGCAALTNPVAQGIPVSRVPPDLLGTSKEFARPIPLNLLRQKPPEVYKLAAGDVLGVWIESVLGEENQSPPVRSPERGDLPAGLGFPIPIRADGTISLPLVTPVKVQGLSVDEAQETIRKAYTIK